MGQQKLKRSYQNAVDRLPQEMVDIKSFTHLLPMKSIHHLFAVLAAITLLVPQAFAGSKAQKAEDLKFYQGLLAKVRDAEGRLAALRAAEGKLDDSQRPTEKQRKALEKDVRAILKEVKTEMSNEDNKERLTKGQISELKEDMLKIDGFFDGEKIEIGKSPQLVDQSQNRVGMNSATPKPPPAQTSIDHRNSGPKFGAEAEQAESKTDKKSSDKDKEAKK